MLSLLFFIYTIVICTVMLIVSAVVFVFTVPFDKSRRVVHELSRALVYMFVLVPPFWRRKVTGLENVDPSKPYVIVINHQSMVDIMALYFLPLNFRWVSKREVFRLPFFGQFLVRQRCRGHAQGSRARYDVAVARGVGVDVPGGHALEGRRDSPLQGGGILVGARGRSGHIARSYGRYAFDVQVDDAIQLAQYLQGECAAGGERRGGGVARTA